MTSSQFSGSYFNRQRRNIESQREAIKNRNYVQTVNSYAVELVQLDKPIHTSQRRKERIDERDEEYKQDYEIRKQMMKERQLQRELGLLQIEKKINQVIPKEPEPEEIN
jgi:hypothetical protein